MFCLAVAVCLLSDCSTTPCLPLFGIYCESLLGCFSFSYLGRLQYLHFCFFPSFLLFLSHTSCSICYNFHQALFCGFEQSACFTKWPCARSRAAFQASCPSADVWDGFPLSAELPLLGVSVCLPLSACVCLVMSLFYLEFEEYFLWTGTIFLGTFKKPSLCFPAFLVSVGKLSSSFLGGQFLLFVWTF